MTCHVTLEVGGHPRQCHRVTTSSHPSTVPAKFHGNGLPANFTVFLPPATVVAGR